MILDNICDKRKEQLERDISIRVSDSFIFKIYQA